MPHMPRLKKVLLVKATTSDELLPHTPITTDLLPSLALSPITDKFIAQSVHPLASTLPTTDKNILYPQPGYTGGTSTQEQTQSEPSSPLPATPIMEKMLFAGKPVAIAGNTLLLGLLSYLLFRYQRAYLFLSWYLLLLLWSYLTFKPVRQLFAQGLQALHQLLHPTKPTDNPASNTYRDEHLRQIQNDTNAYLQALRDLHKKHNTK